MPRIPPLFINNPVTAISGPLLGPKKLCWPYFQEESMWCGLIDLFHIHHCQRQARSFLSHITKTLGKTIQILMSLGDHRQALRLTSFASNNGHPQRLPNVVAASLSLSPTATGITIFHSAQPQVAMAPSQRPWRLLPSPSVSLTASHSHQLNVLWWQHHTFSLRPPNRQTEPFAALTPDIHIINV